MYVHSKLLPPDTRLHMSHHMCHRTPHVITHQMDTQRMEAPQSRVCVCHQKNSTHMIYTRPDDAWVVNRCSSLNVRSHRHHHHCCRVVNIISKSRLWSNPTLPTIRSRRLWYNGVLRSRRAKYRVWGLRIEFWLWEADFEVFNNFSWDSCSNVSKDNLLWC